jgi:hypothetical protein
MSLIAAIVLGPWQMRHCSFTDWELGPGVPGVPGAPGAPAGPVSPSWPQPATITAQHSKNNMIVLFIELTFMILILL